MKRLSRSNRKVCLVAGGAGFIGSNLVKRLLARGDHVDCVDNLITGVRANIEDFLGNSRFRFFSADICDMGAMAELGATRYDEIYDLACPTGVPNIAPMGEQMLLTSSIGTHNLLNLARRCGARFLFASSAEVYGDPAVSPQPETYHGDVNPVGSRSAYEEGKRFGEALTRQYATAHKVDARIIRIFNTYGPNMSLAETRVIPAMLMSLIRQQPVTIYGSGASTRSFQYVDDLLAGFEVTMARDCNGEVFNIGGDREISILQLFEICKSVTRSASKPHFLPHFIEDHARRCPDTARIRALGWQPQFTLEQGLALASADVAQRLLRRDAEARAPRQASAATSRRLRKLTVFPVLAARTHA